MTFILKQLLPDTVELLHKRGMSAKVGRRNMRSSEATGLTVMNIIADCCAGETLARVTDQGAAYASLAGLFIDRPEAKLTRAHARERLLPIPIKVVNPGGFTMEDLIDFRRREEGSADGSQIRSLRHRFVDRMEQQAKRLAEADSSLAVDEIKRQLESDMRDDYRDLQEALKLKALQILGTKEFITAVIAGAGAIAASIFAAQLPIPEAISTSAGAVSVGGLISLKSKWAEERRRILSEHPTAYLYEAVGGARW